MIQVNTLHATDADDRKFAQSSPSPAVTKPREPVASPDPQRYEQTSPEHDREPNDDKD